MQLQLWAPRQLSLCSCTGPTFPGLFDDLQSGSAAFNILGTTTGDKIITYRFFSLGGLFRHLLHETLENKLLGRITYCNVMSGAVLPWTVTVFRFSSPMLFLLFQGEIIYPPPHPPISGQKAFCRGGGWGCVYFEAPRGRNFIPPPFYAPPSRRAFSGVGGGGV